MKAVQGVKEIGYKKIEIKLPINLIIKTKIIKKSIFDKKKLY